MSPSATSDSLRSANGFQQDGVREALYILSEMEPETIEYTKTLFDIILPSDSRAAQWREHAKIILVRDYWITEEDLVAAPQLRAIGKQGVGIDKIDHEACARHGIKIFNTPGINSTTVAELVLALALNVARNLPNIWYRQYALGQAVIKEQCDGVLITGKTLGIVGMGNIGKEVAKMFLGAFGVKVIGFDPYLHVGGWKDIPHTRVDNLDDLLSESDIVSLHVPLNKETRDLISFEQLQKMKPTSILINAARGGIVNEVDLARALDMNLIYGAGLDCHTTEPPLKSKYEPLWNHERFIGTPHIGSATRDMLIKTANNAVFQLYRYLSLRSTIST